MVILLKITYGGVAKKFAYLSPFLGGGGQGWREGGLDWEEEEIATGITSTTKSCKYPYFCSLPRNKHVYI